MDSGRDSRDVEPLRCTHLQLANWESPEIMNESISACCSIIKGPFGRHSPKAEVNQADKVADGLRESFDG